MNRRYFILIIFLLMAAIQLYVPISMIDNKEDVLQNGTEFIFDTAPVDPNDPFRGKYIRLNFKDDTYLVDDITKWEKDEVIYAEITTEKDGFARIKEVTKEKPSHTQNYIKTSVKYIINNKEKKIRINFPFNRYYMEESKAYDAEKSYVASRRDSLSTTCASVFIKDGEAVLNDVLIDGRPIKEVVEEMQTETEK